MENSNTILKEAIIEALGTVYDPEIPVSIWELGLVYNIDIDEKNNILIIESKKDLFTQYESCKKKPSLVRHSDK